jgi:hypothetical protein
MHMYLFEVSLMELGCVRQHTCLKKDTWNCVTMLMYLFGVSLMELGGERQHKPVRECHVGLCGQCTCTCSELAS